MRFVLHLQTIRETQAKHVVIVAMLALNMLTVNQDSKQVNLQLGQTVETALLPQIQCMRVRELDTGCDKVGRCGLKIYATILQHGSGMHLTAFHLCTDRPPTQTTGPNPLLLTEQLLGIFNVMVDECVVQKYSIFQKQLSIAKYTQHPPPPPRKQRDA